MNIGKIFLDKLAQILLLIALFGVVLGGIVCAIWIPCMAVEHFGIPAGVCTLILEMAAISTIAEVL